MVYLWCNVVQEIALGVSMALFSNLYFKFSFGRPNNIYASGLRVCNYGRPASKASVPLVSQMFLMMTTLVFFSLNGHLALIEA